MSYEPSFSKRPGGAAARPRFFSLLGLGSDASETGAPALKVIIDEESNPPSSRDTESAVSLLRTLDSAGDQSVTCDYSFPSKPLTPSKKQQPVSPVAQKFGRRAAVDNKPKGGFIECHLLLLSLLLDSHMYLAVLSPSKSNLIKESHASTSSNHHVQTTPQKKSSPPHRNSTLKPASPQHAAACLSPTQPDQLQSQQPASNENQAPVASVVSPNVASMKPSNVKFGFSKFGFSFSKPKVASPKPVKSTIPSALGSPIAASVATPRLSEHESVQEASRATADTTGASSPDSKIVDAPSANPVNAAEHSAVASAPAAVPDAPSEVKPHHVVGLSTRAQQLMAELAAEGETFGGLDFLEPAKKEKRVLIEKSNLVRKNVKNVLKHAAPFASGLKHDVLEPAASRANLSKPVIPQSHVSAAAAAAAPLAPASAPVDSKQVEHLKRTIDNLKSQLDAARNSEKKVVTLENQLAEQNGLVESMRKEIR
jgi:hypothetical protein